MQGVSEEELRKLRAQKPEVRAANRQQALRAAKEKTKAVKKAPAKKVVGTFSHVALTVLRVLRLKLPSSQRLLRTSPSRSTDLVAKLVTSNSS